MVTCFPPLQPAQWQRSGSAVAAAVEAQWMRGLKPLYSITGLFPFSLGSVNKKCFYFLIDVYAIAQQ